MKPIFTEPTKEDYRELAKYWMSIGNLIKEEYNYDINQSLVDLEFLQKVIDDDLIDFKKWYSLECLGVVLGRVLTKNVDGLDWWVVEDSYGRSLIIRYLESSLQYGVMTMLGKRLFENQEVCVKSFYEMIIRNLDEVKDKVD